MFNSKLLFFIIFSLGALFQLTINLGYASSQPPNSGVFLATGKSYAGYSNSPALLVLSNDRGRSWHAIDSKSPIASIKKSSCIGSGSNAFCVVIVSLNESPKTYDKLVIVNDLNTLEIKSDFSERNKIQFSEISCTSSMNPVCILGGTYIYHGQERQIFLSSEDKGQTWEELNNYSTINTDFHCSGESPDVICATKGGGLNYNPTFNLSTDVGKTWQPIYIPNPSEYLFEINDMNCNANQFCIGSGYKILEKSWPYYPFLAFSADLGQTWHMPAIDNLPEHGEFTSTSCTNDNINCVTIGRHLTDDFHNWSPIIAVSNDSGLTWTKKEIISNPSLKGELSKISCTGSGNKTVCVAVGHTWLDDGINVAPLIVASTDKGDTWTIKRLSNLPLNANLLSIRCLEDGDKAICVAVGLKGGHNFQNYHPFIAVSNDGSDTWKITSIHNLPEGVFGDLKEVDGSL
ncbi:TPA: sialidase family protein [Legionella pneumophila]|nr:exo-alpha-sialidase [Legionella pneumophila]